MLSWLDAGLAAIRNRDVSVLERHSPCETSLDETRGIERRRGRAVPTTLPAPSSRSGPTFGPHRTEPDLLLVRNRGVPIPAIPPLPRAPKGTRKCLSHHLERRSSRPRSSRCPCQGPATTTAGSHPGSDSLSTLSRGAPQGRLSQRGARRRGGCLAGGGLKGLYLHGRRQSAGHCPASRAAWTLACTRVQTNQAGREIDDALPNLDCLGGWDGRPACPSDDESRWTDDVR